MLRTSTPHSRAQDGSRHRRPERPDAQHVRGRPRGLGQPEQAPLYRTYERLSCGVHSEAVGRWCPRTALSVWAAKPPSWAILRAFCSARTAAVGLAVSELLRTASPGITYGAPLVGCAGRGPGGARCGAGRGATWARAPRRESCRVANDAVNAGTTRRLDGQPSRGGAQPGGDLALAELGDKA